MSFLLRWNASSRMHIQRSRKKKKNMKNMGRQWDFVNGYKTAVTSKWDQQQQLFLIGHFFWHFSL